MIASELIKDTLVADGYVFNTTAGDWRLYIGKQPTSPDRVITIYDAPGLAPNPKWLLDYPSVQIRIRGGQNDYVVASRKAVEVRNRLLGRESYNAYVANPAPDNGKDRVVAINAIGDISSVGWDDSQRPEFVFNLAMIVEPSPTSTPTNREPL